MPALDSVDPVTIRAGTADWLAGDAAATLATHPLDCVETEFPHVVHSVTDPDETTDPRADHPVFYGCFDWHSAVHSHWSLVRGLRLTDAHPDEAAITESIDRRFTPENVEREVAYLNDNPTFECPYGWAWLLRLAAELAVWDDDRANRWRETLRPLETRVVEGVRAELLTRDRPQWVGTHGNTAFALTAVSDYARVVGNDALERETAELARAFYADDRDAPIAYEPFGWDFLSPSLTAADLMCRVFDPERFAEWLDEFLPAVTDTATEFPLEPLTVGENTDDGLELHFVGCNLSRAWCLAGIADTLAPHRDVESVETATRRHVTAGVERAFTEAYAGSHWLSSFVLYLGTRNAGCIAPE